MSRGLKESEVPLGILKFIFPAPNPTEMNLHFLSFSYYVFPMIEKNSLHYTVPNNNSILYYTLILPIK